MIPGGREFAKNVRTPARAARAHVVYLHAREGLKPAGSTIPPRRLGGDGRTCAVQLPTGLSATRSRTRLRLRRVAARNARSGRSGSPPGRRPSVGCLPAGRRDGGEAGRVRGASRGPGAGPRCCRRCSTPSARRACPSGWPTTSSASSRTGWGRRLGRPLGAAGRRPAVARRLRRGAGPARADEGGGGAGGAQRARRLGGEAVAIPMKSNGRVVAAMVGLEAPHPAGAAEAVPDDWRLPLVALASAIGGPLDASTRLERATAQSSIDATGPVQRPLQYEILLEQQNHQLLPVNSGRPGGDSGRSARAAAPAGRGRLHPGAIHPSGVGRLPGFPPAFARAGRNARHGP